MLPTLGPQFELRRFAFERYPKHVANLGCYAWKPPIVRGVADEVGEQPVVMWIDSGARFSLPMAAVIAAVVAHGGFVSGETALTVRELTHPKMLEYFAEHFGLAADEALRLVPNATYSRGHGGVKNGVLVGARTEVWTNCDGAFSAHWKGSPRFADVTVPWDACARDQECVCPVGSNRRNHRQDQAALTLLAIRARHDCAAYAKFVQARGLRNSERLAKLGFDFKKTHDGAGGGERVFCTRAEGFRYRDPAR